MSDPRAESAIRPVAEDIDPRTFLLERYMDERPRSLAMRAYYGLKPLLPRPLLLSLRRLYARRQAQRQFPAWPVEPLLVEHLQAKLREELRRSGGERLPIVNFWPHGHRFAAVLTHDVEGPVGIRNISRVLEVERRHGMVSSWNFVARWYPIPEGTFEQIRAAGCEVGLHGIRHDGRLFANRASFKAGLPLIHHYLSEWQAVGFRSPATHRNADWMSQLGCLYDSSFPDTDPFEPQAGGCCSIFPFLIDDLVELPITLPQDHTLWEILRRDPAQLWAQKTEWIVRNHGLVNIIVHPDYVASPERLATYERFLVFLRERLDGEGGWHALPRDVAQWWRKREGLAVTEEDGHVRIAGPGDAPAKEATVAWVREEHGDIVIDAA
jgi:peptidoglycan/xylan/chitin deacetylase (PgdA/CDA1 family)